MLATSSTVAPGTWCCTRLTRSLNSMRSLRSAMTAAMISARADCRAAALSYLLMCNSLVS